MAKRGRKEREFIDAVEVITGYELHEEQKELLAKVYDAMEGDDEVEVELPNGRTFGGN